MEVRWRRPHIEGTTWRYGKLVGDEESNITRINGYQTGGIYNILAKYVQKRVQGPRGGWKWVPMK